MHGSIGDTQCTVKRPAFCVCWLPVFSPVDEQEGKRRKKWVSEIERDVDATSVLAPSTHSAKKQDRCLTETDIRETDSCHTQTTQICNNGSVVRWMLNECMTMCGLLGFYGVHYTCTADGHLPYIFFHLLLLCCHLYIFLFHSCSLTDIVTL